MPKVMIEMDMPTSCKLCPFNKADSWCLVNLWHYHSDKYGRKPCELNLENTHFNSVRPSWCPLQEVKE